MTRIMLVAFIATLVGCELAGRAVVAPTTPKADSCEIRMYMRQLEPGAWLLQEGEMYMAAVEANSSGAWREGVCIKHVGRPLEIPARISLAAPRRDFDKREQRRLCLKRENALQADIEQAGKLATCVWNGQFHAARPFTFTFVSVRPLREDVALLRFYRNGSLVYSWNAASALANASTLEVVGTELKAPSGLIAVQQPPHLADFDLRIWPSNQEIAVSVLRQEMVAERDVRKRARERLVAVLEVTAKAAASPEVTAAVTCFTTRLQRLQAQVQSLVTPVVAPALPAGCGSMDLTLPEDLSSKPSLESQYEALKLEGADAVRKAEVEARERIVAASPLLATLADEVLKDLKKSLTQRPETAEIKEVLAKADLAARETLAIVDQTQDLVEALERRSRELVKDRKLQAEIYASVVEKLESEPSVFEERKSNPPVHPGEQDLGMEYGDKFQMFMFAPWFAVPIRPKGATGADLNASLAIPILDVGGLRWQWGKSRFSEFRLATGIMYFQDKRENGEEPYEAAWEANLSLGTYRIGTAIVISDNDVWSNAGERVRILVGADLLKLITGSNVEAL